MTYILPIFVRIKTQIMDVKLTLRLDREIIERAKKYAGKNKTSLSRMVENFFRNLDYGETDKPGISSKIRKLSGIIHLTEDLDSRSDYTEFLAKKYSR